MDGINTRIAECIKCSNLTKTAFAEKIGVSQPFVSQLCNGTALPSDRTVKDICREFGVNELWLRTGTGDMTTELSRDEEIARILSSAIVSNATARDRLIRALARLPDDAFPMIEQIILEATKALENEKSE